jgi:hypothetical protein
MRFFLLFLFLPFQLLAQKNTPLPNAISGVWAGHLYNDTTGLKNDFELAISGNNGKLSGYTYTVFLIEGKKNIGVKSVKIKQKKDLLLVEDDKLISDNYDAPPAKGVRTFIELNYFQNDTSEILSGTWKTNMTRQYNSVTGTIFLERKKKPEESAIIPKLRQLDLSDQLSFLPKTIRSKPGNAITATKVPDNSKKSSSSEKANVQKALDKTNDLVINNQDKMEKEKIIPDTTIVNPEITIFMFPKNEVPARDTIKFEGNKNMAALGKENISGKKLEEISSEKTKIPKLDPSSEKSVEELLSGRKIETIRTIEIAKDTLIFSLFDNGVVDGDTVSVLLNGKVIMSKVGLLTRAYNDTIYLTPEMGDSINIILFAENLGTIAPNTGLLVVRDGGIDHEIRFSGDLKKNSAIILKRKKVNER